MSKRVDSILGGMKLEEKVGQMLVFGFSGSYPHRDIMKAVEDCHVAGFRITPLGRKFVRYLKPGSPGIQRVVRDPEPLERLYATAMGSFRHEVSSYAKVLNALRQRSLDTGAGIPLYFALDFEGNESADFIAPGVVGFPYPMGLTCSGDPELCYRVARTVATQLKAVGIDWLHSPVLDVNTVPTNPEIGPRSYSALPDVVSEYAAASLRGYTDGNVVATAKHYPGRGHSDQDVHFGIAVIRESLERMQQVHLAPYRALIEKGLPAVMLAHSIFPAIDPEEEIGTVSRAVVTDVLRNELGFDGVVMTDSFTMGGLVAKYEVPDAAVRAIEAGVDLILLKDENALRGEMYQGIIQAVQSGRISEERVEESVARVLAVKERFGLLDGTKGIVDPQKAEEIVRNPAHAEVSAEAASKSLILLRDWDRLLPLKPGAKVLVAEQVSFLQRRVNNPVAHTGALYEALVERGVDAVYAEFDRGAANKEAMDIVAMRAKDVDLIIHTGYYRRGQAPGNAEEKAIRSLGKPTIFVTNTPYHFTVLPEMSTVLVTFSAFAASMVAAADVITGKTTAQGKLGFDPEKSY